MIHYICLKCGGDLTALEGYGTLHIPCKCGNIAKVYTGRNIHFKDNTRNNHSHSTKVDIKRIDEQYQTEIFYKHLTSNLEYLDNMVNTKRDITKQVMNMRFTDVLNRAQLEDIALHYLKSFCDLDDISLHIIWEPFVYSNHTTLSCSDTGIDICGTAYYLNHIYYTIYLNPNHDSTIVIAALAHELSHIYSHRNNLIFISPDNTIGDNAYNEQITDLLGIVLGMGNIMCLPLNNNQSFNTGYLTNEMICRSYDMWKSDFLAGKNNDIKTLIICRHCSQKLRVPITNIKIHITCPKCKMMFDYVSY